MLGILIFDENDGDFLYILWNIDKPFIFKGRLAQLAKKEYSTVFIYMFNILIDQVQHLLL